MKLMTKVLTWAILCMIYNICTDYVCTFISAGLKSISRCSKLLTLKLGICLNITDDGLTHVANGCPKLKELDLYRFGTFQLCKTPLK